MIEILFSKSNDDVEERQPTLHSEQQSSDTGALTESQNTGHTFEEW